MLFSFKLILSYNISPRLVGHVGKKSHLSCSLDCYGKLSLVKSAGTGYASGENLCSLGNKLSELCNILVVDSVYLILTEDANLLSSVHGTEGTLCIVSIHLNSSKPFRLTFSVLLVRCEPRGRGRSPNQKGRSPSLGISSKLEPGVVYAGAPYASGV